MQYRWDVLSAELRVLASFVRPYSKIVLFLIRSSENKDMNGGPCVFDQAFKRMARAGGPVELSHAKGSVQEAARELGIDSIAPANRPDHQMATKPHKPCSVYNCGPRAERGPEADQTTTERAERRSARARYIKKGSRHLLQGRPRGGPWEIFRFIAEHANQFPVEKMCKVLEVSSSGYYYWRKHPVGIRQLKQAQLLEDIRQVHAQSESRYGSPRIADELRERGVKTSRNRVARLMHKAAIRSIMYKKYRVQTTDSSHDYPVAKNLLNRDFTANKPGQNRSAEAMGV